MQNYEASVPCLFRYVYAHLNVLSITDVESGVIR
jgi:hypothetical protein